MARLKEKIERQCPFCGATVTDADFFCRSCHKLFTEKDQLFVPGTQQPPEMVMVSFRNPIISGLFSFLGFGLGQYYNGDTPKGILITATFILVSFGLPGYEYDRVLFFGIWCAGILDAMISAVRINRLKRSFGGTSPLFWIEFAILAIVIILVASHVLDVPPVLRNIFPMVNAVIP
jgi:TM2 domain-containing membrane protein YozV